MFANTQKQSNIDINRVTDRGRYREKGRGTKIGREGGWEVDK